MIIDTLTWFYILLVLGVFVLLYSLKRMSKVRVWIKASPKPGAQMTELGYLEMSGDGTAGEVHLPGGGTRAPLARVVAEEQSNREVGYVEITTSDLEDETEKPIYRQCGYINYDMSVDEFGYIYKHVKGQRKKELVGYCARPSAPNIPTIHGERSWKTLWLVCTLNAYWGKPQTTEKKDEKVDRDSKKKEEKIEKIMGIAGDAGTTEEDIIQEVPTKSEIPENSEIQEGTLETSIPDETNTPEKEDASSDITDETTVIKVPESEDTPEETPDPKPEEEPECTESTEESEDTTVPPKEKDKKDIQIKGKYNRLAAVCRYTSFHSSKRDHLPAEARACAYALLARSFQRRKYSEYYKDHPYGWRDTALLTALIYSVLFLLLYIFNTGVLQMPLLGNDLLAVGILITAYYLLWALVRFIKIDCIENSNSFQPKLDLLNKNLGLGFMNWATVILSIIALYFTFEYYDYDLMPLIWAIGFGVMVNMTLVGANRPWRISSSYNDADTEDEDEEEEAENVENPPGDITRNYEWDLDPHYSCRQLHGSLSLYFTATEMADMRHCNPFFAQRKDKNDKEYILEMFHFLKDHRPFLARTRYIAHYISTTIDKQNLMPLDKIQFTLDFIQEPNIQFVNNRDCKIINHYEDYIRYPDETLYDKEAECNSKSLLAAMLFHVMGYNVLYLASRRFRHAGVAIEVSPKDLAEGWYGSHQKVDEITIAYNGKHYIYCETTGDRFRLGATLDGMKLEDFEEIVPLPVTEETDEKNKEEEDDNVVSRIYNWDLDSELGNKLHGNITLDFTVKEMEELRDLNPFKTYGNDSNTYQTNINSIFDYLFKDSDRTSRVHTIADYIRESIHKAGYPELDLVQFALDFAQTPNITYCVDENSASIEYAKEYMRFPDEVLYDKEGDCDCKSSLTAALFHELGYNVIVMLSKKIGHAAIGVECKDEWLQHIAAENPERVLREYNRKRYLYCETTGDGYKIGHIKENDSIQDFETIIELPV